jgi:hypothetical protein
LTSPPLLWFVSFSAFSGPKGGNIMANFTLMLHATFGLLFIMGSLWVFVEVLNINEGNAARVRTLSSSIAAFMWLAYLVGGYWYVTQYAPEKALILKGPWPFAHTFFMETKEHVILMIVLMATFLPILASNDVVHNKGIRSLMLWTTGLMTVIGIAMEGAGAVISMGAKIALLPN